MVERIRHCSTKEEAAEGGEAGGDPGWYVGITPSQPNTTECAMCGTKTAFLDQENSECLRCVLKRRRMAREGAPTPGGPYGIVVLVSVAAIRKHSGGSLAGWGIV